MASGSQTDVESSVAARLDAATAARITRTALLLEDRAAEMDGPAAGVVTDGARGLMELLAVIRNMESALRDARIAYAVEREKVALLEQDRSRTARALSHAHRRLRRLADRRRRRRRILLTATILLLLAALAYLLARFGLATWMACFLGLCSVVGAVVSIHASHGSVRRPR